MPNMRSIGCAACVAFALLRGAGAVSFQTSSASAASRAPTGMTLVSRVYVPYSATSTDLAFGMGAAEAHAYDPSNRYAYAVSEQGVVNVIDYDDPLLPAVRSAWAIDLSGQTLTDVEVCSGKLFVGVVAGTKTDPGMVKVYSAVARSAPAKPSLIKNVTVGPLPDMLLPSPACTHVAVANEAEGTDGPNGSLIDPEGSVSIIDVADNSVQTVSLLSTGSGTTYDDAALLGLGVHMPLTKKAMQYFDEHGPGKDDINWTLARASYTSATQLEPEFLTWSADGSKIYVNLQENSALATISLTNGAGSLDSIKSYGLKDWSDAGGTEGIDTNDDDGTCVLARKPFKSMRMPDSIARVTVDGTDYILTANEGDDKEYEGFEEKQKFKKLLEGGASFTGFSSEFPGFVEGPGTPVEDAWASGFGGTSMRITIGSSGVDYETDPTAPQFKGAVGFGGRGVSIYSASNLDLVWDSGSAFEKEQCAKYPWAHNGIQDEEFASKDGVLYSTSGAKMRETLDEMNDPVGGDGCDDRGDGQPGACPLGQTVDERSLKDGAGPESIVAGEACGRLLLVTATEKQGTAFVYDITNVKAPELLFLHHLSPASKTKSPDIAYGDGTLGDIDPESVKFLSAADSPTGKAGVMFAGAWSGTLSLYEFTCGAAEPEMTCGEIKKAYKSSGCCGAPAKPFAFHHDRRLAAISGAPAPLLADIDGALKSAMAAGGQAKFDDLVAKLRRTVRALDATPA